MEDGWGEGEDRGTGRQEMWRIREGGRKSGHEREERGMEMTGDGGRGKMRRKDEVWMIAWVA